MSFSRESHPYVVFLPAEQKDKILSAIFGSKASLEILRFFLRHGIANKVYQKDLVRRLAYSNKTIIENLKTLTELGVLTEHMEKAEKEGRTVWVKAYRLSDLGKWFALLIAEEKELSDVEKAEILQNIFRSYIKWVKNLSEKLHVDMETFKKIFDEEMGNEKT
ncbi:MAG: winged helix DNA-binding protein [Candidatus Bathyarchaeia archaeon]